MELNAHDLLRLSEPNMIISHTEVPPWVWGSLEEAPWVVVRRVHSYDDLIPVGIRGRKRSQRFGAFVRKNAIREHVTPEQLTQRPAWLHNQRKNDIEAIRILDKIDILMKEYGFTWGPIGSVGFELASDFPATTATSDVDVLIRTQIIVNLKTAKSLCELLSQMPVKVDVQIDTGLGAVSLAEYATNPKGMLLKTSMGPILVNNPWSSNVTGVIK